MGNADITITVDPTDVLYEMDNNDIFQYLKDEGYFHLDEEIVKQLKESAKDILELVKEELDV